MHFLVLLNSLSFAEIYIDDRAWRNASSLLGFLFFAGISVALYRVGRIRDDVRKIRELLQKHAGEEVVKSGGEWVLWTIGLIVLAFILLCVLNPRF